MSRPSTPADTLADTRRSQLPVVAIILAAGTGTRAGSLGPKQFVRVAGRQIVAHTVAAFQASQDVDAIVVVRHHDFAPEMDAALDECGRSKIVAVVDGGADRAASTASALGAVQALGLGECKLLVHDGVRPLIDARIITDCVRGLDTYDALDVVIPTTDTMVLVSEHGELLDIPRRSTLRRGQTPQAFLASVLERAYRAAHAMGGLEVTDDCAVVARCCPDVRIGTVAGSQGNIKVTHPQDFLVADQLFRLRATDAEQVTADHNGLRGACVVVMGGIRGIGAAIVDALREIGAHVVVPRREDGFDVADATAVEHVLAGAQALHGSVDAVVVTAGVLESGPLATTPAPGLASMVQTNLWGAVVVAQAAHPYLARNGGQLLLFGSSSYTRGRPGYGLYSATKAAVANLTQALADEWHPDGIRVNCLSPGRTATDMRRNVPDAHDRGYAVLTPQRVAEAALDVLVSRTTGSIVDVSDAATTSAASPAASPGTTPRTVALPAPRVAPRLLDPPRVAAGVIHLDLTRSDGTAPRPS